MLDANPDADVRVYAVWFSMYPGDVRDRWPAEVMADPRVVHYWDEDKVVGTWYAARLPEIQKLMAPGSKGYEDPVLWDAYLIYGPDARWSGAPSGLRGWGRTILGTRESLRDAFEVIHGAAAGR